jgi:hypothetical protein
LDLALAISQDPNLVSQKSVTDLFAVLFFLQNFDEVSTEIAKSQDLAITKPVEDGIRFDQYYQAIADQTTKLLINCTARTLPIFNRKAFRNKKCNLTGYTGGILGAPEKLKKPAPYNGDYKVLGFKHVISPSKIYSEFDLLREGFSSKIQKSDVKVKDYLCAILKTALRSLPLAVDGPAQSNEEVSKTSVPTELIVNTVRVGVGSPAAEAVRAFLYSKSPTEQAEYEKRIRKALETMGCE